MFTLTFFEYLEMKKFLGKSLSSNITEEFKSFIKDNFNMEITEIYNEKMEKIEVANHPMETLYIRMTKEVSANDMARKVK